jgi:hypothetical protein
LETPKTIAAKIIADEAIARARESHRKLTFFGIPLFRR